MRVSSLLSCGSQRPSGTNWAVYRFPHNILFATKYRKLVFGGNRRRKKAEITVRLFCPVMSAISTFSAVLGRRFEIVSRGPPRELPRLLKAQGVLYLRLQRDNYQSRQTKRDAARPCRLIVVSAIGRDWERSARERAVIDLRKRASRDFDESTELKSHLHRRCRKRLRLQCAAENFVVCRLPMGISKWRTHNRLMITRLSNWRIDAFGDRHDVALTAESAPKTRGRE